MSRRKPTLIRLLEGNRGKRPIPQNEAKVPPSMPQPPEWLDDVARAEWNRVAPTLYQVGLLTALDLGALTAYVTAWSRYVKAEEALAALAAEEEDHGGLVATTANGNAVQHVLVGVARRASADVVRTAAAFGMTPASRAGVEARPAIGNDDAASEFFPSGAPPSGE